MPNVIRVQHVLDAKPDFGSVKPALLGAQGGAQVVDGAV